jgi:hypothetical protein
MGELVDRFVPASERGRPDWDEVLRLGGVRRRGVEREPRQVGMFAPRRRWKPPTIALAVIVVVAVGGVAIAASWNPLSGIGSADRAAEPTDTLSPAFKEQLREASWPSGSGVIGGPLVDQARLLGERPDGRKVYAVPTSKGKLCILVDESGLSCYDPLTRAEPITWAASKTGPAEPLLIWGATTDDVASVSFEVGGQPVTVPVENNFFAWEGQPAAKLLSISRATITFTDGTTAPAP